MGLNAPVTAQARERGRPRPEHQGGSCLLPVCCSGVRALSLRCTARTALLRLGDGIVPHGPIDQRPPQARARDALAEAQGVPQDVHEAAAHVGSASGRRGEEGVLALVLGGAGVESPHGAQRELHDLVGGVALLQREHHRLARLGPERRAERRSERARMSAEAGPLRRAPPLSHPLSARLPCLPQARRGRTGASGCAEDTRVRCEARERDQTHRVLWWAKKRRIFPPGSLVIVFPGQLRSEHCGATRAERGRVSAVSPRALGNLGLRRRADRRRRGGRGVSGSLQLSVAAPWRARAGRRGRAGARACGCSGGPWGWG